MLPTPDTHSYNNHCPRDDVSEYLNFFRLRENRFLAIPIPGIDPSLCSTQIGSEFGKSGAEHNLLSLSHKRGWERLKEEKEGKRRKGSVHMWRPQKFWDFLTPSPSLPVKFELFVRRFGGTVFLDPLLFRRHIWKHTKTFSASSSENKNFPLSEQWAKVPSDARQWLYVVLQRLAWNNNVASRSQKLF